MKWYSTEIKVINRADDQYEAGERAGLVIDDCKVQNGTYISCEPTCSIEMSEQKGPLVSGRRYNKKYLTRFHVVCEAPDMVYASEKANELFDIKRMENGTSVIWESTKRVT